MKAPTRAHLEDAARSFFSQLSEQTNRERDFPPSEVRQAAAYNAHLSEELIEELERQLISNRFDKQTDGWADGMLSELRLRLNDLEPANQLQARQLAARAVIEQMRFLIHSLTTPTRPFVPADDLFGSGPVQLTPDRSAVPHQSVGVTEPTLREATEEYLLRKERTRVGPSQITEIARLLRWLCEALGGDRCLSSIKKQELRTFRDNLTKINVSLRGQPLSFAERLTDDPANWLKSATYGRYWNSARAFFAWCYSEGVIDADPALGLQVDRRVGEQKRTPEPFTKDELLRLFATPLYAGHKSPKRLKEPGSCLSRDGQWWSAVLLAHTGMRAGELCQLLPTDFFFDAEIPHISIKPEDADGEAVKSVKNSASKRSVPIHSNLMALGLRGFVEGRAKRRPKERVFWEFRLGGPGKYTDGITQFWRPYLKEFKLWKPGRSTHVWRHTVIACLRREGVPEEDVQAVVGQQRQSVTAGYGGEYPLGRKAKVMEMIDYRFDMVSVLGGAHDPKLHGG